MIASLLIQYKKFNRTNHQPQFIMTFIQYERQQPTMTFLASSLIDGAGENSELNQLVLLDFFLQAIRHEQNNCNQTEVICEFPGCAAKVKHAHLHVLHV